MALCDACWGVSLALNCLSSKLWSGWETLARMTLNLDSILLSDTASRESSSTPTMSLALQISLLHILAFATLNLLPQHTTANKISLATTDSKHSQLWAGRKQHRKRTKSAKTYCNKQPSWWVPVHNSNIK